MTFAQRRTEPWGLVELAGRTIKAYEITVADDPVDVDIWRAALQAAETTLEAAAGAPPEPSAAGRRPAAAGTTGQQPPGFVILHLGEDSVWLLVCWWSAEICCQQVLTASLAAPEVFRHAPPEVMACVWELHVIDHERRAWARNVLGGEGGTPAYLANRLRAFAGDPL